MKIETDKYFKRGKIQGFLNGFEKGQITQKRVVERKIKAIEACAQAIIFSKFKHIEVQKATNDLRKATLSLLKVQKYRSMSQEETIKELRNRKIEKLIVPRTCF